ncbi:unnamed protein product [Psylliodes chrysocephalus]|uniref:SIAH-type domain-containing protein n=1 Tax=Psylliodes chrysocephalus TaxID=3402493 RepID=A0A9P0CI96_9CUCU|nr:unnamed protein product [Psylliodes chrysocephala]
MMSHLQYVISDGVCDYCHKFLSVTPVKVYPNRRIKCGRCSTSNDEEEDVGVDSMYNKIATSIFFECINKFDGCTQLLQSSEVVEHERMCLSKMWTCPICLEEMFTFLIIRHFKVNHPESVLENRYFQVTDLKNIEKTFLYQLESDLLFVNFRDESDLFADDLRRFSLNVLLHLGKKDYIQNIKVDFFLFEKNNNILDKTFYTSGSKSVTYNIKLNITCESKLLVMLHLNSVELKSSVVNVIKHKINKIEENNNSDSKICEQRDYLKRLLFQRRDIFPNDKFKESVSNLAITEKATLSYTKSGEKITITFACCSCSLIQPAYFSITNNIYLIGNHDHYYMNCYKCVNRKTIVLKNDFTKDELKGIMFFCIWSCGIFCDYTKLYIHERNCIKQMYQKCPIKSCFCYFKLYEIEDHVKKEHPLVISPSVNLYKDLIPVNLDTSKSAIEHIMLVWYVCVLVKFKWEQPNWSISLTCEIPGIKMQAKVCDKNKELISTIIENGSIPYHDKIHIQLRCLNNENEINAE